MQLSVSMRNFKYSSLANSDVAALLVDYYSGLPE